MLKKTIEIDDIHKNVKLVKEYRPTELLYFDYE